MHNNGSHRLILPDRGPVLSTIPQAPRQGFQIEVRPNALICHINDGDTKVDLTLDPQQATQLGVNLISAATLSGSGLLPPPPPDDHRISMDPKPEPNDPPDPLAHELT